ncbi:MAG: hypothetical protein DCF19_15475 [Pseudanabaena frigida]|uniref:Uncharacterized protein n=1 Tax=Pseudanabaena frigida TaxID=945775 RepID=A0A2W4XU57_9CYAN|nr:MAG: hypothetical protein DCF19_15475 [Pseudanabaena frigida]
MPPSEALSIESVIQRIISLNQGIFIFWSQSDGWTSEDSAQILSRSRLDRQVSLSHCLKMWLQAPYDGAESGQIIMGWANLGSLLEGSLKLFLSVWHETYKLDIDAIKKKDKFQNPDGLQLEPLRIFFKKKIWDNEIDSWVQHIQIRRNAIHAYQDKEIGSLEELQTYMRKYLDILRYINFRLPYHDVISEANEEAIIQVRSLIL